MCEQIFETGELLNDIDAVLKRHIQDQHSKILEEYSDLQDNIDLILHIPAVMKIKKKAEKYKKNCQILAKRVIELRKKISEYENFGNIKLEIKEIDVQEDLKHTPNWKELGVDDLCINNKENNDDDDDDEDDDDDDEDDDGNSDEDGLDLLTMGISAEEGDTVTGDREEGGGELDRWKKELENFEQDKEDISDDEGGVIPISFDESEHNLDSSLQNKEFYTNNKENGKIYENLEGKLGKEIGHLENGIPFFSE